MITVCEKGKCTGCVVDSIIDSNKCINCNACHKACQNNHEIMLTKPIYWRQGWQQMRIFEEK